MKNQTALPKSIKTNTSFHFKPVERHSFYLYQQISKKTKISDLIIIHDHPRIYNIDFIKVQYKLINLKNL